MIATLLTVAVICLMLAGSAALYLLPVLIAVSRQVPDIGSLATVNILLGWTFIGWEVALAMALRPARSAAPAVQNVPPACPPARLSGVGWARPSVPLPPRPGVPPPLILPPRPASPDSASQAGPE
jgi:hypothetical protein